MLERKSVAFQTDVRWYLYICGFCSPVSHYYGSKISSSSILICQKNMQPQKCQHWRCHIFFCVLALYFVFDNTFYSTFQIQRDIYYLLLNCGKREWTAAAEQLKKNFEKKIFFSGNNKPGQRGILFGLDHGQLNTGPFGGCIKLFFRQNITKKGHFWDFGNMFPNDQSDLGSGYINK